MACGAGTEHKVGGDRGVWLIGVWSSTEHKVGGDRGVWLMEQAQNIKWEGIVGCGLWSWHRT